MIINFCFFDLWRQKIHSSKTVRPKRISLTESRGNGSFFILKSGVQFWFRALLGKMIAAPPGWQGAMKKTFIWAWSVMVHSIKNMFKTPGGIRWQIFLLQMKSECSLFYLHFLSANNSLSCVLWDIFSRFFPNTGPKGFENSKKGMRSERNL